MRRRPGSSRVCTPRLCGSGDGPTPSLSVISPAITARWVHRAGGTQVGVWDWRERPRAEVRIHLFGTERLIRHPTCGPRDGGRRVDQRLEESGGVGWRRDRLVGTVGNGARARRASSSGGIGRPR